MRTRLVLICGCWVEHCIGRIGTDDVSADVLVDDAYLKLLLFILFGGNLDAGTAF